MYYLFNKFLLVLFLMHSCAMAMAPVFFPYIFYQELAELIEGRLNSEQNLNETLKINLYEPNTGFQMLNETPLYASTSHDYYLPLTKKLLKNGANPNYSSKDWSRIPLFHAMNYRAVKTVKALLKAGAYPEVRIYGPDKVPLINWFCIDVTTSNMPQFKKSKKIIQLLFKFGANPNVLDGKGDSPLHSLCLAGKKARSITILLLLYGADPSFKNKAGKDVIATVEDAYSRGYFPKKPYWFTFIKNWQEGKIKLRKKKLR